VLKEVWLDQRKGGRQREGEWNRARGRGVWTRKTWRTGVLLAAGAGEVVGWNAGNSEEQGTGGSGPDGVGGGMGLEGSR